MCVFAIRSKAARCNDEAEARGRSPEPRVKRHESASQQAGERDVLGVIRLCPSQLVGDAPRFLAEPLVARALDWRPLQSSMSALGVLARDLASPEKLVQGRSRFRPEQGRRKQSLITKLFEAVRAVACRDGDARVDDEYQ